MTIIGIFELISWNKDNNNISKIVEEINKDDEVIEKEDDENTEIIGEPTQEEMGSVVLSDYGIMLNFHLLM